MKKIVLSTLACAGLLCGATAPLAAQTLSESPAADTTKVMDPCADSLPSSSARNNAPTAIVVPEPQWILAVFWLVILPQKIDAAQKIV